MNMGSISFMTVRHEPNIPAVCVTNATKAYSKKPGVKPIIDNLSMNVQRGKIYSLLGSSGCGKTTLLSCVIGTRRLDSGTISVFGKTPGDPECGVPGRKLGFMPQEIALHGEFSISEELHYFGRIFGMSSEDVEDNKKFLINFLKLPPGERRINSLSGGQQRRVSFAVALVHNPELLILDEPTVGVDPLLRRSIWSHLVKLATSSGISIIITTHFIEEARDANRIGLMRNGKILMEETPLALMKKYQTNILEEIVVELCLKDKSGEDQGGDDENSEDASKARVRMQVTKPSTDLLLTPDVPRSQITLSASALHTAPEPSPSLSVTAPCEPLQVPAFNRWPSLGDVMHKAALLIPTSGNKETKTERFVRESKQKFNRILALLIKNVLTLARNLLFVFFLVGQPALQIVTVCLAIGPDPHDITLAVINNEVGPDSKCSSSAEVGCMMSSAAKYNSRASCEFIKALNPEVFILVDYEKEDVAIRDAQQSKIWGLMSFPANFTENLKERLQYGAFAGLETLMASRITIRVDGSSKLIALLIQKNILEAFQAFMKSTAVGCKFDVEGVDLPVYFGEPVYGTWTTTFTENIAPGAIVAILFFFPICSSAMAMVMEKSSGALERSLVAGVRSQEIMISHFLTQLVLSTIEGLISFLIVFLFFQIEIQGSILQAFMIVQLVGISGITFGFFTAAICHTELEAVLMTIAAFMPNLVISGVIWPVEGMPNYLRIASLFLPCTLSGESLRSIVSRGLPFTHPKVWPGFFTTFGWSVVYWLLALYLNIRKNKT